MLRTLVLGKKLIVSYHLIFESTLKPRRELTSDIGLLEEKGVHHTTPDQPAPGSQSSKEDVSEGKKPSLKEKIKAKLHKH